MNKTERFDLRLKDSQRRAYEECAALAEIKLAEWIRTRLDAVAKREAKRYIGQLVKYGFILPTSGI